MTEPKVLFVEDEMMIAMVIEEVIREAGYDVVHAMTAAEAIAVLDKRAPDFRVLVTDIKMPGGGDGWQVARRARELHPRMGVVYVSGDSSSNWQEHGLPGSIFLQKPYPNEELVLAIGRSAWD